MLLFSLSMISGNITIILVSKKNTLVFKTTLYDISSLGIAGILSVNRIHLKENLYFTFVN